MKLSVIIPAHNEAGGIEETIEKIIQELTRENIEYEIIVVNDNSTDNTLAVASRLTERYPEIRLVNRTLPAGFGRAVRDGLKVATGDILIITMADGSDDPKDIIKYWEKIQEGYDCVFGSRFISGAKVVNYPGKKLFFNRLGNNLIRALFLIRNNDITNAFKAYRRQVIEAVQPLVSNDFNLTTEIPLKAINRGFSWATVPINWYGRKFGVSKHKLSSLHKKYLLTVFSLWLERIKHKLCFTGNSKK